MTLDLETLQSRRAQLVQFLAHGEAMRRALGAAIECTPPTLLHDAPEDALPLVEAFIENNDFATAGDDARRWLVAHLAIYLAHLFTTRHHGTLRLDENVGTHFYGRFVVGGMAAPIAAEAVLDPFALAWDVVMAPVKLSLAEMIAIAERELGDSARLADS